MQSYMTGRHGTSVKTLMGWTSALIGIALCSSQVGARWFKSFEAFKITDLVIQKH
jgi:hypothetical protein